MTFYRAFEDRYRGSRDTIKDRLRAYQPFIAGLPEGAALDLGCGRGEWLELLGEYGVAARGIDLDDDMLAACRERGLAVETMDALAALRAVPDASLALVSAFHLVEHIPFDMVRALVDQALRALRPGGLLILETPNPENLVVGASSFYMDPSHLRPIPPTLLAFAAEHAGFARHQIVRLQEAAQLHTEARIGMISVLEGPSPDYSVVAQKRAPAPAMAALDAAFGAEYGIALAPLAQRYDQQLAQDNGALHRALGRQAERLDEEHARARAEYADSSQRLLHVEQRAQQFDERVMQRERDAEEHGRQLDLHGHALQEHARQQAQQAHDLVQQAQRSEQQAQQLEQHSQHLAHLAQYLPQLEQRLQHTEQHLHETQQHLHQASLLLQQTTQKADALGQLATDLLASTSWRVTAPLRAAVSFAHRLRGWGRRRARHAVLGGGRWVLRHPRVKRVLRALLSRFAPRLQARLMRSMLHASAVAPAPAQAPLRQDAAPGQLSPRATRAYHELMTAARQAASKE